MVSKRYPKVILTQPIDASILGGHPWIFSDAVSLEGNSLIKTGDVVDVLNQNRDFLGRGIYEQESPIRVRIWTTDPLVTLNNQLFEKRLREAIKRRPFPTDQTNGYRVVNGEHDGLPGVTIDRYGELGVIRLDGFGAERWLKTAARLIQKLCGVTYIAVRRSENYKGDHATAQWYGKPPEQLKFIFWEQGLRYWVDPIAGQKTGFFLDQRENRARVAELCRGKRLLNLFSYSGGFSVAAAFNGASKTTSVDIAGPAIEDAKANFQLNDLCVAAHDFIVSDVFDYLEQFAPSSAPFEFAVCDPPSFAHRRSDLPVATKAYIRLFSKLIEVMPNQSKIAFASCSSHIDRARFLDIVTQAATHANTQLYAMGLWGAGIDHPFKLGFLEGDYLQFLIATVSKN